jgi:hypothetical protein
MRLCLKINFLLLFMLILTNQVQAQRNYVAQSVFATGNWYKIAVKNDGIYKVDVAFLQNLGISVTNLAAASIRLYGNGGQMLPENNLDFRYDDVVENAIAMQDGGDGLFNGNDYFLFYAAGPHTWLKDSTNQRFSHRKNLYSDESFYWITIGGIGKRVSTINSLANANVMVNTFNHKFFHETDTINFLKSGKEWYGEEFSNTPGNSVNRLFTVNIPNIVTNQPVIVKSNVVSRSVGANSSFDIRVNGQFLPPLSIPPVSGNVLESFALQVEQTATVNVTSSSLTLNYSYAPGAFNGQGWLNWFEIFCRSNISMQGIMQLVFSDWTSVGPGNVAAFSIANASTATQVWDITNAVSPQRINANFSGSTLSYNAAAERLRTYIAFSDNNFFIPRVVGRMDNQNLHQATTADYIIVTHKSLLPQAQRLALHHQQRNALRVAVATTEQIFNEFASGTPDPTAIRDFVKMYYDKAAGDTTKQPKYLLLFGDASFDYKARVQNNTNLVPAYQNNNSLDPLITYTSDDFFGLLEDNDDINLTSPPSTLDIGIGRIPARNLVEATNMVNKIIRYQSPAGFGPWRNQITIIGDDEDGNIHLNDAELMATTAKQFNPLLNQNKIFLDAFLQESGSGGSRYPAVNQAIANQIFNGTLICNYSGHGGSKRLADEAILDQDVVKQFNNPNKLPLFITATCDFAPYDDPTQVSIGENLLLENDQGAIALMTTTRVVFAFSNRIMNNNYLRFALAAGANGKYPTLGEAVKSAKNFTYATFGDVNNNRKFTLLGDPAVTLGFPEWAIKINTINGNIPAGNDTLKALSKCRFEGEITDAIGNTINNFNGTVFATLFDKAQLQQTLGNDAGSTVTNFSQQTNVLYKGKATVIGGKFGIEFIIPKDINYLPGNGRLSLYANDNAKDAAGVFANFLVGGASANNFADNTGPVIKAFLNNEQFVNGGLVNENPVLLIKLSDSSGINTSGTGIGHDITAVLDGDEKNIIVLNDFYEATLDSYQNGQIRFQLPVLADGQHTLTIKAWDVANNSSTIAIDFVVAKQQKLQISRVLNYPNPFTTKTNFWFEHNQPGESLAVLIQIFSVSGKVVHQISRNFTDAGNRFTEIFWDGRDAYNEKLGKGVYIYRIIVTNTKNERAEVVQKLYLL